LAVEKFESCMPIGGYAPQLQLFNPPLDHPESRHLFR